MAQDDNGADPLVGRFGRWHQLALALGGVLGSGWLMAIPPTSQAGLWSILSWCLALAMIGLITLVVVQLAKAKPSRAGLASWPTNSSGRVVGTVMSAGVFVVYAGNPPAGTLTAITALEKTSLVSGLVSCENGRTGLPSLTETGLPVAWLLMTALFLINLIGFAMVVRVNTALTALKVALPVLFVVLVVVLGPLPSSDPGALPFNCEGAQHPTQPWSGQLVFAFQSVITGGLIFSLTGFQGPIDHGTKRGSRHVGFAMFGALLIATALYVALQVLFLVNDWNMWPTVSGGLAPTVLLVAMVLAPLTNALLFVSLAGQVLRTSATQGNVSLPWTDRNQERRLWINTLVATYAFGLVVLASSEWAQITSAKSVIFLFVYSFAAISYAAYRRTAAPEERNGFARSFRIIGPLSFALATALALYAGLPALLQSYLLIIIVAALMFWSKRKSLVAEWRKDVLKARWLLAYFATLALLATIRFFGQWSMFPSGNNDEMPSHLVRLLLGTAELPTVPQDKMIGSQVLTHVLAALAFVLGLWAYQRGVRRSVEFLQTRPQDDGPEPVRAPPVR